MTRHLHSLIALSLTGLFSAAALAQTAAPPAAVAKPAAKTVAMTKAAAKKPVAAAPTAAPLPALAEADEPQLAAFQMAHLGDYACELKQSVHLAPLAGKPGYLTVAWQKLLFVMKPVLSPTGALRLEDVSGRALLIQIANKSMLLDTKIGQRLVDDCVHPEQTRLMAAAKAAALANPDSVKPSGLGITK